MNKIKVIFTSIIILLLSACASQEIKEIEVVKNEKIIKVDFIHPDDVVVSKFESVNFVVITKDNYKELFSEDKKVFIALDTKNYKNLSKNMQEIIRILSEQQSIILYYKENIK